MGAKGRAEVGLVGLNGEERVTSRCRRRSRLECRGNRRTGRCSGRRLARRRRRRDRKLRRRDRKRQVHRDVRVAFVAEHKEVVRFRRILQLFLFVHHHAPFALVLSPALLFVLAGRGCRTRILVFVAVDGRACTDWPVAVVLHVEADETAAERRRRVLEVAHRRR